MDIQAAKKRYEAATKDIERLRDIAREWFVGGKITKKDLDDFCGCGGSGLVLDSDLPAALEALEEAQANQHDSKICVPKHLYDESNTKGRQLIEAVIPLLDAIRGCDNEIVLEVVRPHSGIVGEIVDGILCGSKGDE